MGIPNDEPKRVGKRRASKTSAAKATTTNATAAKATASTRAIDELWDRMAVLRQLVFVQMQRDIAAAPDLDLSLPQSTMLFLLGERGALSVSALTQLTGRSQSTTSHLVNQLELKGLVERLAHEADARKTIVQLSRRGAGLVERVERMRRQSFARVMRMVPASVIGRAEEAMRALADALGRGSR